MDCNPLMRAVARARDRRAPLRREGHTALRLVNGAADGLPDLLVDDFAGHWLAQTVGDPPRDRLADLLGLGALSVHHKRLRRHGRDEASPEPIAGVSVGGPITVIENGLRFEVDLTTGYSQGLFLDQRGNRRRVREAASGLRVLNTFAYTCGFGVAARAGGAARVVNLDLSRAYLDWGKRNHLANGLVADDRDFIHGDAMDWLARFSRRSETFDLVILDPPTFSRNRRGGVFRVEKDYAGLLDLAVGALAPGGAVLAFANERRLGLDAFRGMAAGVTDGTSARLVDATDAMPPDFPGSHYLKRLVVADQRDPGRAMLIADTLRGGDAAR